MERTGASSSGKRIILILRRWWKLFAVTFLATVAGTVIFTFSATPLYLPQAIIEIRPETTLISSDLDSQQMAGSTYMWRNYYRTQKSILHSHRLLERTIKELPVAIRKGFEAQPNPVSAFAAGVDIEEARASFILKVGYIHSDPATAAIIVNTLVSVYMEEANRQVREMKSSAEKTLSEEAIPDIERRLAAADKAMMEFQAKTGYIDPEDHYEALLTSRNEFHSRLTAIRLEQAKTRAEYDSLSVYSAEGISGLFHPGFHKTQSLEGLGRERVRVTERLAEQKKILKEKHPTIIQLRSELEAIEEKIFEAVKGTLAALQTSLRTAEKEEEQLVVRLEQLDKELTVAGNNRVTYRRMATDLGAARSLYLEYLKKHGESTATAGTGLASIRVVDVARIPRKPYKPNIPLNLVAGVLLGFFLGFTAVLVANRLENRILSPEELEAFTGLNVLAVIPRLAEGKAAGERPVMMDRESNLVEFEAFRSLRTEVVSRLEKGEGGRMISVLSPVPGDGKTTVVANLAAALAMQDRRVLVFDSDIRRPQLCSLFAPGDGPALDEFLAGTAEWKQAVRSTSVTGIDVVGMKRGTDSAAELVGSPRYEEAITRSRAEYDYIIIDSPPVLSAAEATIIGGIADGSILVVRQESTDMGAARAALKKLKGMNINILGAVFNFASAQAGGYGYYVDYYSYGAKKTK